MQPALLARTLGGLCAVGVTLAALAVGLRVLRVPASPRASDTLSESRIRLERQADLAATLVQAALVFQLFNVALTVAAADRLSDSLTGAMCAFGVFTNGTGGFEMLGLTTLSALLCALWLAMHRYDLRLPEASLTRTKFAALLVLAPFLVADLALTLRFALSLDLSVVASCCASQLDPEVAASLGASVGRPRIYFALALFGNALVLLLAWRVHRRQPSPPSPPSQRLAEPGAVYALAGLSALTTALCVPAIMGYVAPHAYASPVHTCPFCLLHAETWGIGWPLFGALFAGLALGLAPALVQALTRVSGERVAAQALQADAARFALYAWSTVLLLSLLPVVLYFARTGGVSVFGGSF